MGAKNKKSPSQLLRMDYDINKNKIGYSNLSAHPLLSKYYLTY